MYTWPCQGQNGNPGLVLQSDDLATVHEQLYSTDAGCIPLVRHEALLRSSRLSCFHSAATWAEFEEHLSKKRPLIVGLKKGKNPRANLHYAVVVGFGGKRVWINDPARRKRKALKRSTFEKKWKSADRWMLLAVPR